MVQGDFCFLLMVNRPLALSIRISSMVKAEARLSRIDSRQVCRQHFMMCIVVFLALRFMVLGLRAHRMINGCLCMLAGLHRTLTPLCTSGIGRLAVDG